MPGKWRAFLLRHLLGRFKIGDDILRHLSTFQRLGETLEVAAPTELLPVGARTAFRAVRTRAAAQIRPDWLWPRWLERQLDPTDPAFTPRGHLPAMQNVTGRNWTLVGNIGSSWEGIVDPTGLVTPWFDGWSLDWWVDAGQGWVLPAEAPRLRQSLLEGTPVVATELPLEDGSVVHHVYGMEDADDRGVVEVVNRGDSAVRVALAVRPYNPEGLAVVERIELRDREVRVDGRLGLELPSRPLGVALGTFKTGDSLHRARAGEWHPVEEKVTVSDHAGLAQAAFLFDLPPGEALRAAFPLTGRPRRRHLTRGPGGTGAPQPLPSATDAADTWRSRLRRGMQVSLPDERLQGAVDANRAYLLLLHDPGDITAGPFTYHRFWFRDAAYQIAALSRWGFSEEAADVIRTFPDRQRSDGFFYSQWREWDANGAAIWTIAEHHRLTRDEELLEHVAPSVERGARWIDRTCSNDRGKTPEAAGLLPAGVSAEHLGPYDYYYWDDLWAWRGLLDAAEIARWRGRLEQAEDAERAAERLRSVLLASFRQAALRLGATAIPAGPTRGVDAGMIGSLAACYPLGLLPPEDPWMRGTADVIRERLCLGDAFYQGISHTGLGTYLTLQLAFVELQAGDPAAWRRFSWLLEAATSTFTWPEAIHPRLPGGCMGDGHHGWTVADVLNFVRLTLLRETTEGLVLLSVLPPEWRGRPVEVRDAPTHHGPLSYRLEWRGEQPVLSWERTPTPRSPEARLTVPGLDPSWESWEPRGEAVLTPPVAEPGPRATSAPAGGSRS